MSEFSAALCDRELIHIPGAVQPHGVLLALQAHGDAIRVIAANRVPGVKASAAAAADPYGLSMFLAMASAVEIRAALAAAGGHSDNVLFTLLLDADNRAWSGMLHVEPDGISLLELEPVQPQHPPNTQRPLLSVLNRSLADIQRQDEIVAACAAAVRGFAALTGFNRVMTYQFQHDWSGVVIAEALSQPDGKRSEEKQIDSYMGLVFPASDIPAQARALYASNGLRLIPDATAIQSSLIRFDGSDAPIDLTRAVLRAVAPVHLHYLANMEVCGSMSVAITTPDGALWGLIACHHVQGPLHIAPDVRQAVEMLARALSWRVSELERDRTRNQVARMRDTAAPFLAAFSSSQLPLPDGPALAALLDSCHANAAAVVPPWPGAFQAIQVGRAPAAADLAALCEWLEQSQSADCFSTDRLFDLLEPALASRLQAEADAISPGVLAIRLGGAHSGWLLLLRHELRQLVNWAGDPRKQPDFTGPVVALSPRASFASWKQEVAGRSESWSEADIATGYALRDAVAEILLRRSSENERHNAELRRRNEETRFFADAAAHDLKEPLWQMQVLSGLVKEGLEDLSREIGLELPPSPGMLPDLSEMMASVISSAARMRAMIDDLTQLAVAGRDPDRSVRVRLRDIADEALDDLGHGLGGRASVDAMVSLEGMGEATMLCDRMQIRRVFQNLLSNALKYRDPDRRLHIVITVEGPTEPQPGRTLRISVTDNGLGFDPRHGDRLFEPFRRFVSDQAKVTEGLGLGLAICQRIVLAHDGIIEAVSHAGPQGADPKGADRADSGMCHGASFHFTLTEPAA